MSLREWDRKAHILKEEMTTLMKQAGACSSGETEKRLLSMQRRLPQIENKIAQALSFIDSQSLRRGFFTSQEKAILHWAGEYAKRAQAFFRDYSECFHELFWAKLVQIRGESVSAHGEGNFFEPRGRKAANKHQRRLYETRSMLKEKLRKLGTRNQELDHRYNHLAISKANREAVCPETMDHRYFHKLKGQLNHPKRIVSLPFEYLNEEAKKLVKLITSIQNPAKSRKKSKSHCNTPTKDPIQSFDYLHLEDPFEG